VPCVGAEGTSGNNASELLQSPEETDQPSCSVFRKKIY
jgi:hypothetical protein